MGIHNLRFWPTLMLTCQVNRNGIPSFEASVRFLIRELLFSYQTFVAFTPFHSHDGDMGPQVNTTM